jgi:hypothetical protein
MTKFIAYAVDIGGTALARYDLDGTIRMPPSRKRGNT